ncbi:response regulator [Gloeocapsopsis sp. IPPAS B-1203]|uniref:response regulator n=1 Tax=Gloeocapsopsis sp. IPPAS B-1203 TaxID=2049454 RepID=UPI000C17E00A|nr:response regulator [Gloeocapsopsis sp. IPPAS B-1203]PIG90567.1 response regulator [Gloeocapsopsis sp. IPPAS B-1203]
MTYNSMNGFGHDSFQENLISIDRSVSWRSLEKLRILVVDDNADDRELLALIIEQEGGEVVLAASANEALDCCQRVNINVLVSDICMPGEDGYTLIKKIRELSLPSQSQIPAIALSSSLSETYREQALTAGFQKYLLKPVDLDELIRAINELVT